MVYAEGAYHRYRLLALQIQYHFHALIHTDLRHHRLNLRLYLLALKHLFHAELRRQLLDHLISRQLQHQRPQSLQYQ